MCPANELTNEPGGKGRKVDYFWAFPVRGLKVTNKRLIQPLKLQFADAGIFSVEQCKKLVESVSWKGKVDSELVYEMIVRKRAVEYRVDSVILVKRRTTSGNKNFEALRTSAEIRAREVCAVMMVLLAHVSKFKIYCGFPDDLRHLSEHNFGFSLDAQDFHWQTSWTDKISAGESVPFSSAKLERRLLRYKWMKGLTRIILDKDPHFRREVGENVRRALGRISEGLYAHTSEDYVLASQTAIEILLSHTGGKESDLKGRIKGLLLSNPAFDLKIDSLFELRNDWVHRGKQITDEQAKECIDIGVAVLLAFANLAARLPANTSMPDLIRCIDFSKHRLSKSELPLLVSEMERAASIREKYS